MIHDLLNTWPQFLAIIFIGLWAWRQDWKRCNISPYKPHVSDEEWAAKVKELKNTWAASKFFHKRELEKWDARFNLVRSIVRSAKPDLPSPPQEH